MPNVLQYLTEHFSAAGTVLKGKSPLSTLLINTSPKKLSALE